MWPSNVTLSFNQTPLFKTAGPLLSQGYAAHLALQTGPWLQPGLHIKSLGELLKALFPGHLLDLLRHPFSLQWTRQQFSENLLISIFLRTEDNFEDISRTQGTTEVELCLLTPTWVKELLSLTLLLLKIFVVWVVSFFLLCVSLGKSHFVLPFISTSCFTLNNLHVSLLGIPVLQTVASFCSSLC